jgi:hypothetical protein
MQVEPNWRLDEILDNRGAAFTMLASPSDDNEWMHQPFNQDYPDFGFADLPWRLRQEARWQAMPLCSRVARRYPALRRLYRHLKGRT